MPAIKDNVCTIKEKTSGSNLWLPHTSKEVLVQESEEVAHGQESRPATASVVVYATDPAYTQKTG